MIPYLSVLFLLIFISPCRNQVICTESGDDVIYKGNCYNFNIGSLNFVPCRTECTGTWVTDVPGASGAIVSIHSEEEMDFFASEILGDSWTGLHCGLFGCTAGICDYDELMWDDGTTIDFFPTITNCDKNEIDKAFRIKNGQSTLDDEKVDTGQRCVCKYILECDGFHSTDAGVCNGHGDCYSYDTCTCESSDYYGQFCEVFDCFGVPNNDTSTCNGNGNCTELDTCVCEPGYTSSNCSTHIQSLYECNDPGDFIYNGYCYHNFGNGRGFDDAESFCESWVPVGSHLVSIHSFDEVAFINNTLKVFGTEMWIGLRKDESSTILSPCPPSNGFKWEDNSDLTFIDTSVSVTCDSVSEYCITYDYVSPATTYYDEDCTDLNFDTVCKYKIPYCNGIISTDVINVCSGRGQCVAENTCVCEDDYDGDFCEIHYCYGYAYNDPIGRHCSSHGVCEAPDTCECIEGYIGENCNITTCFGYTTLDTSACSGNGICVAPDFCVCDTDWAGNNCEVTYACDGETIEVDSCYEMDDTLLTTWGNAELYCEAMWKTGPKGHLATISDSAEYLYITNLLDVTYNEDAFVGITLNPLQDDCDPTTVGVVDMVDGTDVSSFVGRVNSLGNFDCGDRGLCVFYDKGSGFRDVDCDEEMDRFLCEYDIPYCYGIKGDTNAACTDKGICYDDNFCFCSNRLQYVGLECNVTYCNYILSNETENVCNGHGDCWPFDTCTCESRYYGEFCEVTTCDSVYSNISADVCNGYGICWPEDKCSCESGTYYGEFCQITTCDFVFSNITEEVCNGNGDCYPENKCVCDTDYYGLNCEITLCYDIFSNFTGDVCSGHGDCYPKDRCHCNTYFYGKYCNITKCNDVFSNETANLCTGNGECVNGKCNCSTDFYGPACGVTTCFNIYSNLTDEVCSGNGDCNQKDKCSCDSNYYGSICNIQKCYDFFSNDTDNVCSNHGDCNSKDKCSCHSDYYGVFCNITTCDSIFSNATDDVCNNHGNCVDFNDCDCNTNYGGSECQYYYYSCYGVISNYTEIVCSGNGNCSNTDICECSDYYYTQTCNITECFSFFSNDSESCGDYGDCVDYNKCDCYDFYYGEKCDILSCYEVLSNDSNNICSTHGDCLDYNDCSCFNYTEYFGENCEVTSCYSILSNDTGNVCSNHGDCENYDNCSCSNSYYGDECSLLEISEDPPEEIPEDGGGDDDDGDLTEELVTIFSEVGLNFGILVCLIVMVLVCACCCLLVPLLICCIIFSFCLCCGCCEVFRRWRNKKPKAPDGELLTFAFTDIRNSTKLWNKYPISMKKALRTHDRFMRKSLKKFKGFEVKTIGDAFFVAFDEPINALNWACYVQEKMMKLKWPKKLLKSDDCKSLFKYYDRVQSYGTDVSDESYENLPVNIKHSTSSDNSSSSVEESLEDGGEEIVEVEEIPKRRKNEKKSKKAKKKLMYKGMVVRIGIHSGKLFSIQRNSTYKSYDYIGRTINKAARVEGKTKAGFTYVSENYFKLVRHIVNRNRGNKYHIKRLEKEKLKGFKGRHQLIQILPVSLKERDDEDVRMDVENLELAEVDEDELRKQNKKKKIQKWMKELDFDDWDDWEEEEELDYYDEDYDYTKKPVEDKDNNDNAVPDQPNIVEISQTPKSMEGIDRLESDTIQFARSGSSGERLLGGDSDEEIKIKNEDELVQPEVRMVTAPTLDVFDISLNPSLRSTPNNNPSLDGSESADGAKYWGNQLRGGSRSTNSSLRGNRISYNNSLRGEGRGRGRGRRGRGRKRGRGRGRRGRGRRRGRRVRGRMRRSKTLTNIRRNRTLNDLESAMKENGMLRERAFSSDGRRKKTPNFGNEGEVVLTQEDEALIMAELRRRRRRRGRGRGRGRGRKRRRSSRQPGEEDFSMREVQSHDVNGMGGLAGRRRGKSRKRGRRGRGRRGRGRRAVVRSRSYDDSLAIEIDE